MMVTPRAFLHTPIPAYSLTLVNVDQNDNDAAASIKPMIRKGKTAGAAKPARLLNAPSASPSKPVVIPTRTRNEEQRRSKGSNPSRVAILGDSASRHDPKSISPSAAALMAMTALPESRHNSSARNRRKHIHYALSKDELKVSTGLEALKPSSSSSSLQSWEILLSPPDESEQETASVTSDSNLGPLQYSIHSFSSDSMPSLEGDAESIASTSNLSTPAMSLSKRGCSERRSKTFSGEDCLLDHPLLPKMTDCDMDCEALDEAYAPEIRFSSRSTFQFKSNLTASLRILRSAATSLSNFTAATVQRDDYLIRSLLFTSPQLTDERRPLPSADVPDPALRRYLNPITLSPAELHFHPDPAPYIHCTTSIQLQTYHRAFKAPLHHNKATAPPVFTSHPLSRSLAHGSEPLPSATSPSMSRQREPRENSDFLRIIVLEMSMRKMGKLSEDAPGKAKLWLPPRLILPTSAEEADLGPVPRRWIGTTA